MSRHDDLARCESGKTSAALPASAALETATSLPDPYPSKATSPELLCPARDLVVSPGRDWRLHKHADYQRAYQSSRKQFSSLMSYFVAQQPALEAGVGPRVGITAGKVLGKAVDRNRIKRRMRAAIVSNLDVLQANVDVILHPKRSVLNAEWASLEAEVGRIFHKIQDSSDRDSSDRGLPERRP